LLASDNYLSSLLQFSDYYLLFLALLIAGTMFFIGGINSILPYIIYLSLLWVFLIVGFSGKVLQVKQLFAPVSCYADNHALQYYDSEVIHYYYHHTPVRQTLKVQKDQTTIPGSVFFPPAVENSQGGHEITLSFDFHYYSFFGFRGPPSANILI